VTWEALDILPQSELVWTAWHARAQDGDDVATVYRLCFSGTYPAGSRGNRDARLMMAITGAALAVDPPDAVVFDFAQLDYRWGGLLAAVFQLVTDRDRRYAVAAGPIALPAVTSLLGAAAAGVVFPTLDEAWARAAELAVARLRASGERV
jgi:hypothetical protein